MTDAEARQTADAVLLDMDGTLVLSESVHRQCWDRFFEYWGMDVSDREYEQTYMGRRATDVMAEVPGPWTGADTEESVRTMTGLALSLAGDVEAVPGAPDLTRWLKSLDVPVAVVTSAGAPWADRVLSDKLGVRHLVDAVVSAEQVTVGKPSWAVQFSRPGV
ncbi:MULTISPECIES: HAD family phosphatase [unclassified Streptomyces]|uniref:HAD family hydrolase n=1 Tax=unclassified Streptomyces TaxID=2593676 RepID=UPI0013DD7FBA|nr:MULTISPECIES: HAD family phosphatase [unclassified Streptomyces]NMI55883.1 HAD family phosphatase [Streptomyces sp. RLA2-12]